MPSMGHLESNLAEIKRRIAAAAARSGRAPEAVEIMAVTKTLDFSQAESARSAGVLLFGENRVQEAIGKYPDSPRDYRLHLIGHLQRNKAKLVPGFFDCVESIDKIETAAALDRRCADADAAIDILLEYNTSGEETKSGFESPEALEDAIAAIKDLRHIRLRGLMTIGPFTRDMDRVRAAFCLLRDLFDSTKKIADSEWFDTLSMGMSSDYEIAVEEGSTRVRIGTALFGRRDG